MLPFRCPALIALAMLFLITKVTAQGDAESSKYEPGRLFVKFSDVLSPGELREGQGTGTGRVYLRHALSLRRTGVCGQRQFYADPVKEKAVHSTE